MMLYKGYWYRYRIDDTNSPMWDIADREDMSGDKWSFSARVYSLNDCLEQVGRLSNYKVSVKTN